MSPDAYATHINAITDAVVKVLLELFTAAGIVCTAWTSFQNKRDISNLKARSDSHSATIKTILKDTPTSGQINTVVNNPPEESKN